MKPNEGGGWTLLARDVRVRVKSVYWSVWEVELK